ncbi:hypothetical protein HQQ80_05895 [Microbacteriaceae bacterium VKM Ac-2855]|nr:hypothetical protein [Microbacteriaceae bacterium VKM Ac-2855]
MRSSDDEAAGDEEPLDSAESKVYDNEGGDVVSKHWQWVKPSAEHGMINIENSGTPNVDEERAGVPWAPIGGDFYLSSQYFEPEHGPSSLGAEVSDDAFERSSEVALQVAEHLEQLGLYEYFIGDKEDPIKEEQASREYARFLISLSQEQGAVAVATRRTLGRVADLVVRLMHKPGTV